VIFTDTQYLDDIRLETTSLDNSDLCLNQIKSLVKLYLD